MSPPEDYVAESEEAARVIEKASRIEVRTLLNIGCGGGHNDKSLKRHFSVTGVDISRGMLALARRLNPEVEYRLGDMRTVRLNRRFDAVTIFDSISYMQSLRDLKAAFKTAFVHLRPGGVFLTFAEETRESFRNNRMRSFTGASEDVDVVFFEIQHDTNPRDTVSETTFVYIIRRGGKLTVETDGHQFGLFSLRTWLDSLRETGFRTSIVNGELKSVWGGAVPWIVCRRP